MMVQFRYIILVILLKWLFKLSFKDIGIKRVEKRYLIIGALSGTLLPLVTILIFPKVKVEITKFNFFNSLVVGPFVEELFFRGLMYGIGRKIILAIGFYVYNELLFMWVFFWSFVWFCGHKIFSFNIFVSMFIWTMLIIRTRSIFPSWLGHFCNNLIVCIIQVIY